MRPKAWAFAHAFQHIVHDIAIVGRSGRWSFLPSPRLCRSLHPMSFWQSLKAWLQTEASDLKESTDRAKSRLETDLNRRERLLDETPEEALERLQGEIDDSGSSFDDISDRIGHRVHRSEVTFDDDPSGPTADRDAEDILDLDSEEIETDD